MAQTLTEARKVAWEIAGVGPDPARCLVIFKKVGGGKALQEVLKPGAVFKRPRFTSENDYQAYAVSTDRHLRHDFSRKYQLASQAQFFILHFDLELRVADPRLLALAMEEEDPLQRLEKEVARVLSASARRLEWEILKKETPDFGALLLQAETPDSYGERKRNFDRLNDFAADLGFGLQRIDVTRSLTEDVVLINTKTQKVATELEIELEIDRLQHAAAKEREQMKQERDWLTTQGQVALRGLERLQTFLDEVNNQGIRALSQATNEVRSFPAIHNALKEIQVIQASFSTLSTGSRDTFGGGPTPPALGGGTPGTLLPPSVLASDPLERTVLRVFEGLRDFAGDPADRRRLLALVLHLVAEVGLGAKADAEFVEAFRGELAELFAQLDAGMEQEQTEILRRVLDIEALRRDLGPEASHGGA